MVLLAKGGWRVFWSQFPHLSTIWWYLKPHFKNGKYMYMSFWLIYKGYKFIVISVRFIWNLQEINLVTCCCKFSSFGYEWRRCRIFLCDVLILSYDTLMGIMVTSYKLKKFVRNLIKYIFKRFFNYYQILFQISFCISNIFYTFSTTIKRVNYFKRKI